MKNSMLRLSLLALVLIGCKTGTQPTVSNSPPQSVAKQAQSPPPAPLPKFGWKQFYDETYEASALGELKVVLVPRDVSKIRVVVQAHSAVYGGMISRNSIQGRKTLLAARFATLRCSLMRVEKGERTCSFSREEEMAFVVRDAHTVRRALLGASSAASAYSGHVLGAAKGAEMATDPNTVSIQLSAWHCIENCGNAKSP